MEATVLLGFGDASTRIGNVWLYVDGLVASVYVVTSRFSAFASIASTFRASLFCVLASFSRLHFSDETEHDLSGLGSTFVQQRPRYPLTLSLQVLLESGPCQHGSQSGARERMAGLDLENIGVFS